MKKDFIFVCPETKGKLSLEATKEKDGNVSEGFLINSNGKKYPVRDGIPDLTYPEFLPAEENDVKNWYDKNSEVYDKYTPLTFKTYHTDETFERMKMINSLEIKSNYKILETSCGTGRDSELIAPLLGSDGEYHVQDISGKMLEKCLEKISNNKVKVVSSVSNACYLPYPDKCFDAYFHFGGINTFTEKSLFFKEISRVVKSGGKVVVGDENMPYWYRNTEFGKILMNSNEYFKFDLPLSHMHYTARDVSIRWIIGGVYYFIAYTVGEGEPKADFDFEIPGLRGGTHRTRYYGHLEGVTSEAVELAKKAREKSGVSMHKWLDEAIKNAAKKELGK